MGRLLALTLAATAVAADAQITAVRPVRATQAVPLDPDDPAIWVNRAVPAKSLIVTTYKASAPRGGLAVFDLDGKLRQMLTGPDRPNNVDVEYGLKLAGTATDIAVLTERDGRRLRAYAIASDASGLRDISGESLKSILKGAIGAAGAPMGIGLYRRPRDGAIFAIVSPKMGPRVEYLWQYRLEDDGTGHVGARFVRRFGNFVGRTEIEAVAVDDELGYVYYADEGAGIHKWHADPDAPDASRELALFGTNGYRGDREGIGIYTRPDGTGFIVSVDQMRRESVFHLFRREGEPGRPHDHSYEVLRFTGGADETDGLDVTSVRLQSEFADGLLVAMNSAPRNFLLYSWSDVAAHLPRGAPRMKEPVAAFTSNDVTH